MVRNSHFMKNLFSFLGVLIYLTWNTGFAQVKLFKISGMVTNEPGLGIEGV